VCLVYPPVFGLPREGEGETEREGGRGREREGGRGREGEGGRKKDKARSVERKRCSRTSGA